MMQHPISRHSEKRTSAPGFIGYLLVVMWFLLTVMTANAARAQEPVQPIVLTATDILPHIEQALAEKGMAQGAEIVLKDPQQKFATTGDIAIAFVSYNERSGRFVIRLQGAPAAITGFAQTTEIFPVLAHPIDRGGIIQETDIIFVETAGARTSQFVRNADDLIGMKARRPIRAQTPLRASDIETPVLIKKGALVTLTYGVKGLRLSHQGVALGAGGAGDVITVRNVQSDRVLKAVVDGENIARVASPRPLHTTLEG